MQQMKKTQDAQKRRLLVVDDIEINRMLLSNLFEDDFDILEAEDGVVAWDLIQQYQDELAIVLLDLVMPKADGFEVLEWMNESRLIQTIPVILITGEADDAKALNGYRLGVSDLITKPFNADIVYRRVKNVELLYAHNRTLEQKLREQAEELQQSHQFLIDAMSTTVEFRSYESGTHIKRVRDLTQILLEEAVHYYPLSRTEIDLIASVSVMHDIGKIAIPDSILTKPGRLTSEEFEIMKTHTTTGCEILSSLHYTQEPDYYRYCYDICRHHHERWDGRGYPDGLKGDEIPIWAQAVSIADVYDALTSERVYKPAYSPQKAREMILAGECGAFNPKLLECFAKVQNQLDVSLDIKD